VLENIRLGMLLLLRRWQEKQGIEEIADTFPRLKDRFWQHAITMSSDKKQMLVIARSVAAGLEMILLDEPSKGIMPVLADKMFELFLKLKKAGKTILLVERG
jgi:branched-chain amino acid transport system ATP-binding protein